MVAFFFSRSPLLCFSGPTISTLLLVSVQRGCVLWFLSYQPMIGAGCYLDENRALGWAGLRGSDRMEERNSGAAGTEMGLPYCSTKKSGLLAERMKGQ